MPLRPHVPPAPIAALAAALALAGPAPATELAAGVEEIQACVEKNLPAHSADQDLVLERKDRTGESQRIKARLYWKRGEDGRSRVLIRVEAPPDLRDAAFLLIQREGGDDMFTYVPELRTVRRITTRTVSGSLFGTDFSYEDVQELQSVAERAKVEKLPDATLDGRPVHVLVGTPTADSGSAYEKIVSYVDAERCATLKTELYGKSGHIAKELVLPAGHLVEQDGRWIPDRVVLRDLEDESETTLTVKKARYDTDLPERLFSQSELAKGH
jgi:hypothetical protein